MARLFVDSLMVIDFSYLNPERGLLGESWLLDVELDGSLDGQGMVLDFGAIKQQVKQTVDEKFDHRLLVPALYAGTEARETDGRCDTRFRCQSGQEIRHSGPANATCLLGSDEVTSDSVAKAIAARLRPALPDNVSRITVRLHGEVRDGSYCHVSHGLKHHAGNCQRIAHGHRSYIEIYQDGKRSAVLEADWAALWCDIYIGTRDDLAEELERDGIAYYRFSYRSRQGVFELELPRERCYLIESDSTVENLAQHIMDTLKTEYPDSHFLVRAFEGIGKGAIAEYVPPL